MRKWFRGAIAAVLAVAGIAVVSAAPAQASTPTKTAHHITANDWIWGP